MVPGRRGLLALYRNHLSHINFWIISITGNELNIPIRFF